MISKNHYFTICTFLLFISSVFSQATNDNNQTKQKFTLSGTVTDAKSNETLIGVNIFIPELKTGITTNEYGFYSITIPRGTFKIQLSYIGYKSLENM
jgi:hypothetical protein